MTRATSLLLLAIAACSSDSSVASEHVKLDQLGFEVPDQWSRTDSKRHGLLTSEWRPADNAHKESLVVMRTENASEPVADGDLGRVVVDSQRGFHKAMLSKPRAIKTRDGMSGVVMESKFMPPGSKQTYFRAHAVFVDAKTSALIHVLYTAQTPDPKLRALELVIDSLRREEA